MLAEQEGGVLKDTLSLKLRMFPLVRALVSSRISGRPLFLSHLITTRCNCRCPMCLWRDEGHYQEMSAAEIGSFYRDSRHHGFVQVGIWGGEPLLREDLGEILYHARRAGLFTVLLTNGYYLKERLEELTPYLDSIILSLDYAGKEHDRMRGCPGLFERVISAMETLRRFYPHLNVSFNCLLHRGNEDQIISLAKLAEQLKVSFFVCPVKTEAVPGSGNRVEEWKSDSFHEKRISLQLKALKRKGYPLNNSYTYLQEFLNEKNPYTCHLPKISLMVYPDGKVVNCLDRSTPLGNVRRQSVGEILKSPGYGELKNKALSCNHCNNPNVVDSSFLWELRRESWINAIKVLLKR